MISIRLKWEQSETLLFFGMLICFVQISRFRSRIISLSATHTHTYGSERLRQSPEPQGSAGPAWLTNELFTNSLFSHTFTLVRILFGGLAICWVCQLSLTRAQMSRLWPHSFSPNLIWWLSDGFFPELLPGVRGGGAGTLLLQAWLTRSITVTVPQSDSHLAGPPACSVALLQKKWGTKTDLAASLSPPGDTCHIFWANCFIFLNLPKEDPNILINGHMQLWHAPFF